jgi:hypothetical protein
MQMTALGQADKVVMGQVWAQSSYLKMETGAETPVNIYDIKNLD